MIYSQNYRYELLAWHPVNPTHFLIQALFHPTGEDGHSACGFVQHAPDQLQPLCIVSAQAVLAHISKSLCLLYRPVRHTLSPNSQVLLSGQPIHHSAGQYLTPKMFSPAAQCLQLRVIVADCGQSRVSSAPWPSYWCLRELNSLSLRPADSLER